MNAESATDALIEQQSALRRLRGQGRVRGVTALVGPAFVAAVAYIDPGNFATNFAGGARFGYTLAWVIVMANLMAMLVQWLSAKLGVATGYNLPELSRRYMGRRWAIGLWMQAEIVAIATDLAEFVGAAIALNLLFRIPPLVAGVITAIVAFGILALEQRGYRKFELAVIALLFIVLGGFVYEFTRIGPSASGIAGGLVPSLPGADGAFLAVGIIGATVMPHVIYLHSALTQRRIPLRDDTEKREVLRFQRWDVIIAMGAAGMINLAMLFIAAALFHTTGHPDVDSIIAAHAGLGRLVGGGAALAFVVALLASGLSSSSVGTYAGQVVMAGYIQRRIPLYLRRAITMAPALLVLGLGLSPTDTLVVSQVVLSFGIPFALVPLLLLTRRADVMGTFVNRTVTTAVAGIIAAVIIALNLYSLYRTLAG